MTIPEDEREIVIDYDPDDEANPSLFDEGYFEPWEDDE